MFQKVGVRGLGNLVRVEKLIRVDTALAILQ